MQMISMRERWSGGSCNHNIAGYALTLWGESYEIFPLGFPWGDVHRLLRIRVPTRFATELDPGISEAVVSVQAGALGAPERMVTVGSQLVVTPTCCCQRGVLASLTRQGVPGASVAQSKGGAA